MNSHYPTTMQTFYSLILDGLKFGLGFVALKILSFHSQQNFGLEKPGKIITIYSIKCNKHSLSAILCITMLLLSKLEVISLD